MLLAVCHGETKGEVLSVVLSDQSVDGGVVLHRELVLHVGRGVLLHPMLAGGAAKSAVVDAVLLVACELVLVDRVEGAELVKELRLVLVVPQDGPLLDDCATLPRVPAKVVQLPFEESAQWAKGVVEVQKSIGGVLGLHLRLAQKRLRGDVVRWGSRDARETLHRPLCVHAGAGAALMNPELAGQLPKLVGELCIRTVLRAETQEKSLEFRVKSRTPESGAQLSAVGTFGAQPCKQAFEEIRVTEFGNRAEPIGVARLVVILKSINVYWDFVALREVVADDESWVAGMLGQHANVLERLGHQLDDATPQVEVPVGEDGLEEFFGCTLVLVGVSPEVFKCTRRVGWVRAAGSYMSCCRGNR